MKIKFGALVVAGSGKIGGHVAAKNRGGAYLRTKVTPTNAKTPAQLVARSLLASLSTAWGLLTEAQRTAWNAAVALFATTDIFGDMRNPSGINLFVKINANRVNVDRSILNDVPPKQEVPFSPLTAVSFSIATSIMTFTFGDIAFNGIDGLIRGTGKLGLGVSFVKSQLRVIGFTDNLGTPLLMGAAYVAKFGAPVIGDNIFISVHPTVESGQKGIEQKVKLTITA